LAVPSDNKFFARDEKAPVLQETGAFRFNGADERDGRVSSRLIEIQKTETGLQVYFRQIIVRMAT
jgi:hypothetical protein